MTNAYEKLGAFYLGKNYDLDAGGLLDELTLLDSKDLTTHGVCFGMTGSGKTGLCICLLEEALIDGIPVIAIDPKGDLTNLLLNFPELRPEDFRPWIQESAARQKGQTPDAYAAGQAELWKKGLAQWGQSGERIRKLRDAADMAIYTPGSEAGLPVSMLKSFAAPSEAMRADRELLRERIQAVCGSLLGLLGIKADPLQSREFILLSLLLDKAWQDGRDLSIPELMQQIQNPPIERVGLIDLESFFPANDRFRLMMTLNNLLASPGFEAWVHGDPLDIDRMLYTAEGKPRISIFSIAHLGDAERMFFVSSLLGEMLSWMRRQSGTTSLRALLYMDEVFGYLPPTANPPSKQPLMTLMKQARAFGVGVVLATQNPKDIDYKALSNAGVWFIGRLQTDRDRDRVLDGLEGAAAGSGTSFDRKDMARKISGLGQRVFMLYNVHDDTPTTFQTRWALSYLSGPMTRVQIERLMADRKQESPPSPTLPAASVGAAQRPILALSVPEFFVPVRTLGASDSTLVYEPSVYGLARVHYSNARHGVQATREFAALTALRNVPDPVDWTESQETDLTGSTDFEPEPAPYQNVEFAELPAQATKTTSYTTWARRFATWLYNEHPMILYRSPSLKLTSEPNESERDFRIRLEHLAREERDRLADGLRARFQTRFNRLTEQIRRAEQALERKQEQAKGQTMQAVISVGSGLLGALFGRKALSATNVRRVGTAVRSAGRVGAQKSQVGHAEENLEVRRAELEALEVELQEAIASAQASIDPLTEVFEEIAIRPQKSAIDVRLTALAWLPVWRRPSGERQPAWK